MLKDRQDLERKLSAEGIVNGRFVNLIEQKPLKFQNKSDIVTDETTYYELHYLQQEQKEREAEVAKKEQRKLKEKIDGLDLTLTTSLGVSDFLSPEEENEYETYNGGGDLRPI